MSNETKRKLSFWGSAVALVFAGLLFFNIGFSSPAQDQREIVLIAKEMAFFLENSNTPNPTLTFFAGEKIRLKFVNQDVGIAHDVAIPELQITTGKINYGDSTDLSFRAPQEGNLEYICTLHPAMMKGFAQILGRSLGRRGEKLASTQSLPEPNRE